MITKLLFTVAVIALAYLAVSNRNRRPQVEQPRRPELPRVRPAPRPAEPRQRVPRYLLYAFPLLMIAGSGLFLFLQWQDSYRVVTVRVINTNTGSSVSYQARRGDVGERSFETLDGRRVVLAAVERMEMGGR